MTSTGVIAAELNDDWRENESSRTPADGWAPSLQAFDSQWDWIQLTSGEWLKGELRSVSQDVVDFDSDKLGVLSLDWSDVKEVYSARPMAVMRRDNTMLVGRLRTENGQLVIDSAGARSEFVDVISIARSSGHERDYWFGDIAAGANLRGGNVDQRDINIDLNIWRRTGQSAMRINYVGNYSEFDSQENANDHRATLNYDYRLDATWFLRPLQAEYFRDPFQNIDYRIFAGVGGGLFLINQPNLEWILAAGPGYQETRFVDTPAGESDRETTPVLFVATYYDQELTSSIDLVFSYQLTYMDERSGRATHSAMAAFDIDLTDSLDLRLSAYWDRIENPQPDNTGAVPARDDYRLVIGLDLEL